MAEGIAEVIRHYYPRWNAPPDTGREWETCLCPFHGDGVPSAAVSYEHQAFNCMSCTVRGDIYSIIKHEEEVNFAEAKRRAAEILVGGNLPVPREFDWKSSRRVFGEPRSHRESDKAVRSWVRRRTPPWT